MTSLLKSNNAQDEECLVELSMDSDHDDLLEGQLGNNRLAAYTYKHTAHTNTC